MKLSDFKIWASTASIEECRNIRGYFDPVECAKHGEVAETRKLKILDERIAELKSRVSA